MSNKTNLFVNAGVFKSFEHATHGDRQLRAASGRFLAGSRWETEAGGHSWRKSERSQPGLLDR